MRRKIAPASHNRRRGVVVLWIILALPVLITLLGVLLEVANLYVARAELKNALEAASQAAVKDWFDNGNIQNARIVGNNFAMSNNINGQPVDLTTIDPLLNHCPNGSCNENVSSDGVLVFAAVIDDDPDFAISCCQSPGCGIASVVVDASAQSSLGGQNNEWGISFQPTTNPLLDIRIHRVILELPEQCDVPQGAGNNTVTVQPRFNLGSLPGVSGALLDSQGIVTDNCPNGQGGQSSQADVAGVNPASINFFYDVTPDPCLDGTPFNAPVVGQSRTLAIEFPNVAGDPQERFDLTDRIRFGADVIDATQGQLGGDEVGACMTQITICYTIGNGTQLFVCTGNLADTMERSNQCSQCATVASWGINEFPGNPDGGQINRGLIVHPAGIPDLPCPPAAAAGNNGQSYGTVTLGSCQGASGAGLAFAVRAQATYPVQPLCSQLLGIPIGPFQVSAQADALVDCVAPGPQLYHLKPALFASGCVVTCP